MRAVLLARGLDGGALLLYAHRLAGRGDRRGARVVRVLAARQLTQTALLARHPSAGAVRAGVVVDALHGTSMLALAGVDRGRRRQALVSAATSAGLILGSWPAG